MSARYRFSNLGCLLVGVAIAFFAPDAFCEWPHFSRADIGIGLYWEQRDILLDGDEITDDELRVGFEVAQEGYWEDPRIVAFNYLIRPTYSWRDYPTTGKQDTELTSYRIGINILRGALAPVDASLRSSLTNNEYKATLAGDTVSRIEDHVVELRWKLEPFPLRFAAQQRDFYRKSFSGYSNSITERHDLRRNFTVRGRSSKLSMRLDHETNENRFDTALSESQWTNGLLSHIFNWGRNSSLRTRYEYRNRERDTRYVSNLFTQDYHVQHMDSLFSGLNYHFEDASGGLDANTLDARYQLTHQLYSNLITSGNLRHLDRDSEFDDYSRRTAGIKVAYHKNFSGINVSLAVNADRSSIDSIAKSEFLEVIDQGYTVPPSGNLLLDDNFIVEESVVITNLTGVFVYVRGVDYDLLAFGSGRVMVAVIPGGEIGIGQTILVSYSAVLAPSARYDEKMGSFYGGLHWRNLHFSFSSLRIDTDLKSGFLRPELAYRRERHSDLSYSWDRSNARFRINARSDVWETPDLDLSSLSLEGSMSFNVSQNINASLLFEIGRSTSESTDLDFWPTTYDLLDTDFSTLRVDAKWRVTGNFTIKPSVMGWKRSYRYRDITTRSFDEDIITANLELDYQLGKLSTNLRLFYNDRQIDRTLPNPDYSRTEDGFRLTIRRDF
jgi:hypothetical protein